MEHRTLDKYSALRDTSLTLPIVFYVASKQCVELFMWLIFLVHMWTEMFTVPSWRSEDNFWESVLFFHRLGPENRTHPLGHVISPVSYILVSVLSHAWI